MDEIVARHSPRIKFGYRAIGTEVHLKLAAHLGHTEAGNHLVDDNLIEKAHAALDACDHDLRRILGDRIFGIDETTLVDALADRLAASSATVSVAESCTGGLIARTLTDRPGSSSYFLGGSVTYSDESKTQLLAVDADVVETRGAVSEAVAAQMASNIRQKLGATWGLSATGIAGPGGGTEEKPVGTVYVGLAGPDSVEVERLRVIGDRDMIRSNTTMLLLDLLRRKLGP